MTTSINIRFTLRDRRVRLRTALIDMAQPAFIARMRVFIRRLQAVTPVRTGFMQRNWYWRRFGDRVIVSNRAHYAGVVIDRNPRLAQVWQRGP